MDVILGVGVLDISLLAYISALLLYGRFGLLVGVLLRLLGGPGDHLAGGGVTCRVDRVR